MTKPKNFEADYFMRENAKNRRDLKKQEQRRAKKAHDEELRKIHSMKCPKCGHDLETVRMSYIDVDRCTSCGVLVLEADDIEKFIAEERSILKVLIDFFK